jgi:medium-chain acyl-[acyl-carrier-protein] hydrolase
MGAWLAFELARALRRKCVPLPELLIVAAACAPHFPLHESPIHTLSDEELVETVARRYGGIPTAVRNSPELLKLLLPSLRADLRMVETYRFDEEPPLDVEVFALGGSDDPAVSAAQLDGWRRHTARAFSVRFMPGGHFFLFHGNDSCMSTGTSARVQGASSALRMIVDRVRQLLPP